MNDFTIIPEYGTYERVVIHPNLNPNTPQSIGFYDAIINSKKINYKGNEVSMLFLHSHAQMRSLFFRRLGWVDITEEWFSHIEKQKEQTTIKEDNIVIEKPIKKKRGRPRKKAK